MFRKLRKLRPVQNVAACGSVGGDENYPFPDACGGREGEGKVMFYFDETRLSSIWIPKQLTGQRKMRCRDCKRILCRKGREDFCFRYDHMITCNKAVLAIQYIFSPVLFTFAREEGWQSMERLVQHPGERFVSGL